jgi:predicted transcriptional regulator
VVGGNVGIPQQGQASVDATLARSLGMKLDRLAQDMSNSFMRIETALTNLDKRIDSLENRHFHSHGPRLDNMETRAHHHEVRLSNLETRGMELTMDDVETGRLLTHAMVEDIPAR